MGRGRGESSWYACAWSRGYSLVADGPLEPDALLALEEALRVDLRLDRLEPREAVRAPDALLQRDALLLLLGIGKRYRTKLGVVGLEGAELVSSDVVVLGASEDLVPGSRRVDGSTSRTSPLSVALFSAAALRAVGAPRRPPPRPPRGTATPASTAAPQNAMRMVLSAPRSTTRVLFLGSSASCSSMALFLGFRVV